MITFASCAKLKHFATHSIEQQSYEPAIGHRSQSRISVRAASIDKDCAEIKRTRVCKPST
jgi:hypothetical protein